MSSLTSTLAASITASHSNIHARRPATLLVRPLPSTPTPCSKSTKPAYYPTTYRQRHHRPLISLPLSSHIPTAWERPCELTDSPTPSTFYPRSLSWTRTLSKSKSHAANHRRHRQSDIANPARRHRHRHTGTTIPCSPTGT